MITGSTGTIGGSVLIGVANKGEISIEADVIKNWEISNINYFSNVVYFKHEDTYYSMKREDFKLIFNK